ncbi:ABC transporter permease [Frankia sp. CNm7]|uniref:ABC transporter permease n=1 Tax=Frankia nepalensis TaxID=1836974 RepID=A0A937RQY6_9ACTN|nr:ABC transporter permease [Frankia nepalensis]MBL7502166.1 ABC transporter permease [Frankia nepalensis]MBL7510568.1 ABC transporter permease [Frankia nepalensis]MBL7522136.1 ABC transporter permease [Frankia nepalensis]MBL7633355.1 ABC transporter permease [Frankia nepalensis]
MILDDGSTILSSAIRLAAPLAFAACGEYLAERAGTMNISIEGMMITGAFTAIATSSATGSASLGLLIGAVAGLLVGLVHGNASHRLAVNTFVVGLTLNVLALGATSFFHESSELTGHQVTQVSIPVLRDIPLVGEPLFVQRWPVYLLIVFIPLTWYLVERTRWGLELRAVGENPQGADVTGIRVNVRRRQALLWCGLFSGLGGAHLAVGAVGSFNDNMTAGRGYLVIAAVIFGAWRLRGTMVGVAVFGFADALRLALPAVGLRLNSQLLIAAPYLLALAAMVAFVRRTRQPAALGKPFTRGIV